MNKEKFIANVNLEVQRGVEGCMWLSVSNPRGFKGVFIVMAYGPNHAIAKAFESGFEPEEDDEVEAVLANPNKYAEEDFDRLIGKEELIKLDYIEVPTIH